MDIFDALILGVLQGITEFLPISSSGHLVLFEDLLGLPVEDLLVFDISVHFGTLLAIVLYFWRDFMDILRAAGKIMRRKTVLDENTIRARKMIAWLIIATIPAVIAGLLFGDYLSEAFRNRSTVAVMLIFVGLYFILAEWVKKRTPRREIGTREIILIGIAQAFALIPGISRSGSTIATGVIRGIKRTKAARFSFLLGSVAIFAATVLSLFKIVSGDFSAPALEVLFVGITSSFVAGFAAIALLMKFLRKYALSWFSIYLIILGGTLLLF